MVVLKNQMFSICHLSSPFRFDALILAVLYVFLSAYFFAPSSKTLPYLDTFAILVETNHSPVPPDRRARWEVGRAGRVSRGLSHSPKPQAQPANIAQGGATTRATRNRIVALTPY